MNENEYFYNTRDVSDWFRMHLRQKYTPPLSYMNRHTLYSRDSTHSELTTTPNSPPTTTRRRSTSGKRMKMKGGSHIYTCQIRISTPSQACLPASTPSPSSPTPTPTRKQRLTCVRRYSFVSTNSHFAFDDVMHRFLHEHL